ncbi:hypothetical protein C8R46DRAFT_1300551 [Mycena filopes]|nr:hypothetical protein C8R46DRAFT_1300551 [Mycena filopes]
MNESTASQLTKEKSLWFTDATLVLQAETRLFRVSPGILAAKSPVFHDMLSFPQPQDGETVDGCPLVRLTDSGDDMTFFLKAIFHYDFFEPWPSTPKFPVVAGILRLSQKYQVDPLWKRALIHLSERCATSLKEAEELYDWEDAHPIELVNLAREVSADWLLPAAFAGCCWLDPAVLVHGVPAGVGRTTALTLSPADVVLCLRAAVALHTTWSSNLVDFMWEPLRIPGCTAPDECLEARLRCRREVEESRSNKVSVLCLWHDGNWFDVTGDFCATCVAAMRGMQDAANERYWQALPGIFDLPGWSALLAMKNAALKDE